MNPKKGKVWVREFNSKYQKALTSLRQNPLRHPIYFREPFGDSDIEYRYFEVGWFTVFYSFDGSTVTVWYIKNSKSDFTVYTIK
jgi:hypothetical protein